MTDRSERPESWAEPDGPPAPPGAAWDHEPTRRAMRRYQRSGPIWAVAGVVVLLMALVVERRAEERSDELARTGERVTGVIVDADRSLRSGQGRIAVRFRVGDTFVERDVNVGPGSDRYAAGDRVEVIYDPGDLSRVRTSAEDNDSAWVSAALVTALVAGTLALPGGAMVAYRARRWRRALQRSPWRLARCRYEGRGGPPSHPLLALDDGTTRVVRGFTSALAWRPRRLRSASTVWVAGALDERVQLVAPPGGRPILEVRQAWLPLTQRSWERACE